MKHALTAMTLALALGAGGAMAETVWKWTGKNGQPVYGKQPPAGVQAEQVDIREANVARLGPTGQATGGQQAAAPAGTPGAAKRKGNPLAQAAMVPVEIGGRLVESGSVRLKARAEGRDLNPSRATCPPEVAQCRPKGAAPTSGSRSAPPVPIRGPVTAPAKPADSSR